MISSVNIHLGACLKYDRDRLFQNIKVIDFPLTFVGSMRSQKVTINCNDDSMVYFKTRYNNSITTLHEAKKYSNDHRAFDIFFSSSNQFVVTFKPSERCLIKGWKHVGIGSIFMIDLRIMAASRKAMCCNNENHFEISRYYIRGRCSYLVITHEPKRIVFGDIKLPSELHTEIVLSNNTRKLDFYIEFQKVPGFFVEPPKIRIAASASQTFKIKFIPRSLKVRSYLTFTISSLSLLHVTEENVLKHIMYDISNYNINIEVNIGVDAAEKRLNIESLHKIIEPNPDFAFTKSEINFNTTHEKKYMKLIRKHIKPSIKINTTKIYEPNCIRIDSGEQMLEKFTFLPSDVSKIFIEPMELNLKMVAINSVLISSVCVINKTNFSLKLNFLQHKNGSYTCDKNFEKNIIYQILPMEKIEVTFSYFADALGKIEDFIRFRINKKYLFCIPFTVQVNNACLRTDVNCLKFGIIGADSFITTSYLTLYNDYNINVSFEWQFELEMPFEIIPKTGSVPSRGSMICDIYFLGWNSKCKLYSLQLLHGNMIDTVDIMIITKKCHITLQEHIIDFTNLPINIETEKKIILENRSYEEASYSVVEPLLPGISMYPSSGKIKPKSVNYIVIKANIPALIEFSYTINVKVNHRETFYIPLVGNTVLPSLTINPKILRRPRLPCELITYLPFTLTNTAKQKFYVDFIEIEDPALSVHVQTESDIVNATKMILKEGETKEILVKMKETERRAYEFFLPIRVNNLIGPPDINDPTTTDLQTYLKEYSKQYEDFPEVTVFSNIRDMALARITGIFTMPTINFSQDEFNFGFKTDIEDPISFTITNISKDTVHVLIMTSNMNPVFQIWIDESKTNIHHEKKNLELDLDPYDEIKLKTTFNPLRSGKYIELVPLYLNESLEIPYYNLTLRGIFKKPILECSKSALYLVPTPINIKSEANLSLKLYNYSGLVTINQEIYPTRDYIDVSIIEGYEILIENEEKILTVKITTESNQSVNESVTLKFFTSNVDYCEIKVHVIISSSNFVLYGPVSAIENKNKSYPYYPQDESEYHSIMNRNVSFIENWIYWEGFKKEINVTLPDTFYAISKNLVIKKSPSKNLISSISFVSFLKRLTDNTQIKTLQLQYIPDNTNDELFVETLRSNYKKLLVFLLKRGATFNNLKPEYLLSYNEYATYTKKRSYNINSFNAELLSDADKFYQLSKQFWFDFILQTYKVFVANSCFLRCDCLEINNDREDIDGVLMKWYNDVLERQSKNLNNLIYSEEKPTAPFTKVLNNLTTSLQDSLAFVAVTLHYCPYLMKKFKHLFKMSNTDDSNYLINNASAVIRAWESMKIHFPICSKDIVSPNYFQMLFLSIHLYTVLPTLDPKQFLDFEPELLKAATKKVTFGVCSKDSMSYNISFIDNIKDCFSSSKNNVRCDSGKQNAIEITFRANYLEEHSCILLLNGRSKTRLFDTYMVFLLKGRPGNLTPHHKYKISLPLYKSSHINLPVNSPFKVKSTYQLYLTESEPTLPVEIPFRSMKRFLALRLNLEEKEMVLSARKEDTGKRGDAEKKVELLGLLSCCLSTAWMDTWVWFRGEPGDFFIKISSRSKGDTPLDTLAARIPHWPVKTCNCGAECECYRTGLLTIPNKNLAAANTLRSGLAMNSSTVMLQLFDELIESPAGRMALERLLVEDGTHSDEISHVLRDHCSYRAEARGARTRPTTVDVDSYSSGEQCLGLTLPLRGLHDRITLTLTSDCGRDVRCYKVYFCEDVK